MTWQRGQREVVDSLLASAASLVASASREVTANPEAAAQALDRARAIHDAAGQLLPRLPLFRPWRESGVCGCVYVRRCSRCDRSCAHRRAASAIRGRRLAGT